MSEGPVRSTGGGRPRLPPAALERIRQGEKVAIETLQKAVQPYTPANPDFIYQPSEINAGCWKVIDHLAAFAETIFDIQGCEYADLYPEMVQEGGILVQEIRPEVVERTKRFWTKWETLVDLSLRARWAPEYYRAYLEEANKPGSEDEKLVRHFEARLEEIVEARIRYWRERSTEKHPVQERSSEPTSCLNDNREEIGGSELPGPRNGPKSNVGSSASTDFLNTAAGSPSITGPPPVAARAAQKKRGRPTQISNELKEKALAVRGGKERAKILYQTQYPTVQQVKNVPTILKHFNRKLQP